jgi:hypothetical protein
VELVTQQQAHQAHQVAVVVAVSGCLQIQSHAVPAQPRQGLSRLKAELVVPVERQWVASVAEAEAVQVVLVVLFILFTKHSLARPKQGLSMHPAAQAVQAELALVLVELAAAVVAQVEQGLYCFVTSPLTQLVAQDKAMEAQARLHQETLAAPERLLIH